MVIATIAPPEITLILSPIATPYKKSSAPSTIKKGSLNFFMIINPNVAKD
jgi:hypothetical protein